jgi:hypothetical protein
MGVMSTMSARACRPEQNQESGFISKVFEDHAKQCAASVPEERHLIATVQAAGMVNSQIVSDICSGITQTMRKGAMHSLRSLVRSVEDAAHVNLRSNMEFGRMIDIAEVKRQEGMENWCDPVIRHLRASYGGSAGKDQAKRDVAGELYSHFDLGSSSPNAEMSDKGASLRISASMSRITKDNYSSEASANWDATRRIFQRAAAIDHNLDFLLGFISPGDELFEFRRNRRAIAFNKSIPLDDGLAILPRKSEIILRIPNPKAQALSDFIGAWGPSRPEAER